MEKMATLSECRHFLKEKLDDCFIRREDPSPGKRFAPRGVTREIFDEGRLDSLFRRLLHSESTTEIRDDSVELPRIVQRIRGSGDFRKYCDVLAILLYSRCMDESLRKFSSYILEIEPSHSISDDDLPVAQEDAIQAFGNDDGHQFWGEQYVFCPVVLKEGDESLYVDKRAPCPLPFVEEPKEIGKGAYAVVKKVIIEKGHLVNEREKSENEVGLSP